MAMMLYYSDIIKELTNILIYQTKEGNHKDRYLQLKVIVPLSTQVERTLSQMKPTGKLKYPLPRRLAHPNYYSKGDKRAL
ncbi:hypothetical protein Len3610_15280 [Lentibacillus sp. CBA3610]|nr:hypothetical protein Len3610_15280 [Lentibacillus sp. CBA3610]